MKTQVFKNSEPVKSSDSMMVFAMIIFWGLLLFAVDNVYVLLKKETSNSLAKHENGLQFRKMIKSENAVGNENVSTKNPGTEIEFSMAKMQEYLIPETEPKLEVGNLSSIVFPDVEMVKLTTADNTLGIDYFLKDLQNLANEKTNEAVKLYALEMTVKENLILENEPLLETGNTNSIIFQDVEPFKLNATDNTLGTDYFLKDLQNLANKKTNEAVEFYALQMKARKCLTCETELALQLEDWMFNEKCWCTDFSEPMALSEGK